MARVDARARCILQFSLAEPHLLALRPGSAGLGSNVHCYVATYLSPILAIPTADKYLVFQRGAYKRGRARARSTMRMGAYGQTAGRTFSVNFVAASTQQTPVLFPQLTIFIYIYHTSLCKSRKEAHTRPRTNSIRL